MVGSYPRGSLLQVFRGSGAPRGQVYGIELDLGGFWAPIGPPKTSQEGPKGRPRATHWSQKLPKSNPREPEDHQKASKKTSEDVQNRKRPTFTKPHYLLCMSHKTSTRAPPGDHTKSIKTKKRAPDSTKACQSEAKEHRRPTERG